jgi:hypothetical protein
MKTNTSVVTDFIKIGFVLIGITVLFGIIVDKWDKSHKKPKNA